MACSRSCDAGVDPAPLEVKYRRAVSVRASSVLEPVCIVQLPEIVVKIAISNEFRHVVVGSLFLEQGAVSIASQNPKITL